MIATGGLLRYNARRQDSLRAKPKPKPKKKRKKRGQEVVVVRGRIQLCSGSGVVAVLGLVVLFVGGVLAAVGYCPQQVLFQDRAQGGATNSSEKLELNGFNSSHNLTLNVFLTLLHRFLDSDRLKICGPLVMGVGIFLFLCANAVLHENRDKKTKVIKLQDIYSTVIDLHLQNKDRTGDQTRDQAGDQARDQAADQDVDQPGNQTGPGAGEQEIKIQNQVQIQDPQVQTRNQALSHDLVQSPEQTLQNHSSERGAGPNGEVQHRSSSLEAELNTTWPTIRGGSVRETGRGRAYAKWWRKKGGSVRERGVNRDGRSKKEQEGGAYRSLFTRHRGKIGKEQEGGASKLWWRGRGCSMRERQAGGVFSVFHEQRFSLPRGFSFNLHRRQASANQGKEAETMQPMTIQSEGAESSYTMINQREEAESVDQETADTSLSVIGSRRLLLMMSHSSLSPAHQRRGSTLSHTPSMCSTNRRRSWI